MKVLIKKTDNAIKVLTTIMSDNGFSIVETKPLVTRLSYKGLTFKIGTEINNGVRLHSFKPNGKWMIHTSYKDEVEYSIDFESLKKELDRAYEAKVNRDGLKKAVYFHYSLYQIYLIGVLNDIGIEKESVRFSNNDKKTIEFVVKSDTVKYCFSIRTYTNKELESFISSEFNTLIGSVHIKTGVDGYYRKDINITDFINDTVKRVHDLQVATKKAVDDSLSKMVPITKETDKIIESLKAELKIKCDKIRDSYPILTTYKDDINAILKYD